MSDAEKSPQFFTAALYSVCRGLDSMRMESALCDLQVAVGEHTFDCHLLLLASVSGFFRSLTSSVWLENQTRKVTLGHDDVTVESFQMFLNILYKAEDPVTMSTATDILRMSIFLQVNFLEQHCIDFLIRGITPQDCVGIWMFAEKYKLPLLANRASAMASDEISKVVDSEEILQLPKSMLLVVLGAQRALSMDDTCRTILRWVEVDADARSLYFEELLPFVSFPQLSPAYIHELLKHFGHRYFMQIKKQIFEALSYNLQNQTAEVKREVLGQQTTVMDSPLVKKCAVVLTSNSPEDTKLPCFTAFCAQPYAKLYSFTLPECPEQFEGHAVAACVHRNELYVSRGMEQETSLIKYMPGTNGWESLPKLDYKLEKHSMSAVGDKIYLIGGTTVNRKDQRSIACYDVHKNHWSKVVGQLQQGMEDATSAVVGHRIYVFGGKDGTGTAVKAVQCVDSRSGKVYVAGELPSLVEHITALSDGGTIFLLCDCSRVLRMKEFFELADRKESALNIEERQPGSFNKETVLDGNPPFLLRLFTIITEAMLLCHTQRLEPCKVLMPVVMPMSTFPPLETTLHQPAICVSTESFQVQ